MIQSNPRSNPRPKSLLLTFLVVYCSWQRRGGEEPEITAEAKWEEGPGRECYARYA